MLAILGSNYAYAETESLGSNYAYAETESLGSDYAYAETDSSVDSVADSYAEPHMAEFDAEYFAIKHPEIANYYGYDKDILYRYYVNYGYRAGMKPYDDGERCIVIIGDSRVCGLLCTLMRNEEVQTVETYVEGNGKYMSGKFRDDDRWIVLSGEMSGRLSRDSYDRSVNTVNKLISRDATLSHVENYIFINMYGINDLYHNQNNASGYPAKYIAKDTDIYNNFRYADKVYQFNSGPVDERGIVYKRGFVNEYIEEYNKGFVSTDDVTVVDLYTYLREHFYNGIIVWEGNDNTGLHYDDRTNNDIYDLIMKLSRE